MNTLLKIVGVGLLGGLILGGPFNGWANLEVVGAVQIRARADFDAPLAVHGSWVELPSHGRCWRPARVAVSWQPYCNGIWVWTDHGWYWSSNEPWAWATYHYGTWAFDSGSGWVWVPGIEWAPAWVHWRAGGGYVGWAPCPPRGLIVAPRFYAFVPTSHFQEPIRPASLVANNATIINQTKPIIATQRASRNLGDTRPTVVRNDGPDVTAIQKAVGKEIRALPIHEAVQQTAFPKLRSSAKPVSPDLTPAKQKIDQSAEEPEKTVASEPRSRETKDKKGSHNQRTSGDRGKGKL
jgi:hypothetical protein